MCSVTANVEQTMWQSTGNLNQVSWIQSPAFSLSSKSLVSSVICAWEKQQASVRPECRVNLLFMISSTQPSYLYVIFLNVSDQGMEQGDFPESKVQMKGAIIIFTLLHK